MIRTDQDRAGSEIAQADTAVDNTNLNTEDFSCAYVWEVVFPS